MKNSISIPTFATTIGVFKNCKPVVGAVFAPKLNEMVYFDGQKAYWNFQGKLKELLPNQKFLNKQFLIAGFDRIDFSKILQANVTFGSCAVSEIFLATGRASAYFMSAKLWDVAGSWALLNYLGFKHFDYATEKKLESINSEIFSKDFKFKNLQIVCKPHDFTKYKRLADKKTR